MKIMLINGGPRKKNNTAALLDSAAEGARSAGAETETVHLYDLNYRGCISCFACKLKDCANPGHCAMKDELTPVLEKILECDALILGSPVYFGDVTGMTRSLIERLVFPPLSYDEAGVSPLKKKIQTAFFFTMNMPEAMKSHGAEDMFKRSSGVLRFLGSTEYLVAYDTYQFDDYSKYASSRFDVEAKKQRHEDVFPQVCAEAYEIGKRFGANG